MRLIQFINDEDISCAVWDAENKRWMEPQSDDFSPLVSEFLDLDPEEQKDLYQKALKSGQPVDLSKVHLLAPVLNPSKILCVGLNYADHAEEFNDPVPQEPVIFCKAVSSINGPDAPIVLPKISQRVDYEAELVVVIGQYGKDIDEKVALDYVAGYTCGNDVSARDWQKNTPAGQWFLGKSFDSFAPTGPVLVLKDEIENPNALAIQSRLNGQVMQSSNTKHFIFPVQKLISYISRIMTLEPGDLIFTGTPGGVGDQRKPPVYLKHDDIIEVEIEKIGVLSNSVGCTDCSEH